jgi:hypothetical protein
MVKAAPEAVLHPASAANIAMLIRSSWPAPFPVAARGSGHSWRGQALAPGGVVVDMRAHQRARDFRRGAVRRRRRRAAVDRRPTRDAEARSCANADGDGGRGHATASASNTHQPNFAQKFW